MKCIVCHQENAQFYDDLNDLFTNNTKVPFCEKHREEKIQFLNKKCRVCGSEYRTCCC